MSPIFDVCKGGAIDNVLHQGGAACVDSSFDGNLKGYVESNRPSFDLLTAAIGGRGRRRRCSHRDEANDRRSLVDNQVEAADDAPPEDDEGRFL